jgi:hypothetical protein
MSDLTVEPVTSFSVRRLSAPIPGVRAFQSRYEEAVPNLPLDRVRELVESGAPWSAMVDLVQAAAPHSFFIYFRNDEHPVMANAGHSNDCVAYLMGNHVIAEMMYRHDPRAMLYAHHHLVQARHEPQRYLGRQPSRSRTAPPGRQLCGGLVPQRVHHQSAPRRRHRRPSPGGLGGRRGGPPSRPRRPGTPPRSPPVLLEKRQMGRRPAPPRPRRTRFLGAERLPQPGRPLARTALPRRPMPPTSWQPAIIVHISPEAPTAKHSASASTGSHRGSHRGSTEESLSVGSA